MWAASQSAACSFSAGLGTLGQVPLLGCAFLFWMAVGGLSVPCTMPAGPAASLRLRHKVWMLADAGKAAEPSKTGGLWFIHIA